MATDAAVSPTATSPVTSATSLGAKLHAFGRDIKLSHSVFALPWALLSTALAGRAVPGSLTPGKVVLIVVCMVAARTVAMAANRLLDAELDAKNPRTARRAIPGGTLSRGFVATVLLLCAIAFVAATAVFQFAYRNPWPLVLALPVLAYLCGYPLMKRFTRLCHYYLGGALALAPVCAYLAITGHVALAPVVMFGAVLTWTAGFDIIYACQDYDVDVRENLFSVPSKLGIAGALWVARLTHLACVALLVALGVTTPYFHAFYFTGVAIAVALLAIEHTLVKPTDLSKVGLAFFTMNGVISVAIGALGIIDLLR